MLHSRARRRVSSAFFLVMRFSGAFRVSILPRLAHSRRNFLDMGLNGSRALRMKAGPSGQICAASDEAGSTLVGDIGPCPLNEHQYSIAEADKKKNVDEEPGQPGD